ncbi:MAG TPA: acyl carrier protein [Jatrophihabitans sp.]|nr:acyl carrier protein [Jatrophihabitans sp.]
MPEIELAQAVTRVITRIAPDQHRIAAPDAQLISDLGFQSLAVAELGFALVDLFDVMITPEQAFGARRVTDVITLVGDSVSAGHGRLPSAAELAEWEAGYCDDDSALELR